VAALLVVLGLAFFEGSADVSSIVQSDPSGAFRVGSFAQYIKMLSAGVGIMLALLAWPSDRQATGNSALNFGTEGGEFFALCCCRSADLRRRRRQRHHPAVPRRGAGEHPDLHHGVASRARCRGAGSGRQVLLPGRDGRGLMLFGFSYLYGTTGTTSLSQMTLQFASNARSGTSARYAYAVATAGGGDGDRRLLVQDGGGSAALLRRRCLPGAATPVTALLSYVPKTSGLVALLKLLFTIGGAMWAVPLPIGKLIWIIAVLTMTVGNVLGLLQQNVKRVLAYSSIAHSGYLLWRRDDRHRAGQRGCANPGHAGGPVLSHGIRPHEHGRVRRADDAAGQATATLGARPGALLDRQRRDL
jgi:hypothetical protein